MNPIKVFQLKELKETGLRRNVSRDKNPSQRNDSPSLSSHAALTPQRKLSIKRIATATIDEQQRAAFQQMTQKKLQLVYQQPQSYSPKKRIKSTTHNQIPVSPPKLPGLKASASSPIIYSQPDLSPKLKLRNKDISSTPVIRLQEVENSVRKGRSYAQLQPQGRSSSQVNLRTIDNRTDDIVRYFISKTSAGQNGNRQPKTNQDSIILRNNLGGVANRYFFGIADGHGLYGHYVSQLVCKQLPLVIESNLRQITSDDLNIQIQPQMQNLFDQSFNKVTKELSTSGIDITFSGTTCVTVLISGQHLWCGNIGDSRAVLVNQKGFVDLSRDHKPDAPSEKQRILSRKGRVRPYLDDNNQPVGPARVWLQNQDIPGLAMARSFGDQVASTVGVISEPELKYHFAVSLPAFLIVASDGIWEFVTSEEVKQRLSPLLDNELMSAAKLEIITDEFMALARQRWLEEDDVVDDISIVLAYLNI